MKKLLAILVVALLATSISFATNQGTGTVVVTVTHPAIEVSDYPTTGANALTATMQPGTLAGMIDNYFDFEFQAVGAYGVGHGTITESWSSKIVDYVVGNPGVFACNHLNSNENPLPVVATYNDTGAPTYGNTSRWQVKFGLYCAPGTTENDYTVTYTLTVNY